MRIEICPEIEQLVLQIRRGPEQRAIQILASNRADQPFHKGMGQGNIGDGFDFGHLQDPQVGLPLPKPIKWIVVYNPGRDVSINPNYNSILTPQRPVPDVRLWYTSTGQCKIIWGKRVVVSHGRPFREILSHFSWYKKGRSGHCRASRRQRAAPKARHHFTQLDQVTQLVNAAAAQRF